MILKGYSKGINSYGKWLKPFIEQIKLNMNNLNVWQNDFKRRKGIFVRKG